MATATYDPAQVILTFLGVPMYGYADGTFVSVERNEDAFTLQVGADGETARARNRNRSGRITFTLMQSSVSNDILSGAANADELTGLGIGPAFIKDNTGRTVVTAANAWVMKLPTMEMAKELGTREWVLECDNLTMFIGGNV